MIKLAIRTQSLFLAAFLSVSTASARPEVATKEIFEVTGRGEHAEFRVMVEKTGSSLRPYRVWDFLMEQKGPFSENGTSSSSWKAFSVGPAIVVGYNSVGSNDFFRIIRPRFLVLSLAGDRAYVGRSILNVPGAVGYRLTYRRLTPEAQREFKRHALQNDLERTNSRQADGGYFVSPEIRREAARQAEALLGPEDGLREISGEGIKFKAVEFTVNNAFNTSGRFDHGIYSPHTEVHTVVYAITASEPLLLSVSIKSPDSNVSRDVDLGKVSNLRFDKSEGILKYEINEGPVSQSFTITRDRTVRIRIRGTNIPFAPRDGQETSVRVIDPGEIDLRSSLAIRSGARPFVRIQPGSCKSLFR